MIMMIQIKTKTPALGMQLKHVYFKNHRLEIWDFSVWLYRPVEIDKFLNRKADDLRPKFV